MVFEQRRGPEEMRQRQISALADTAMAAAKHVDFDRVPRGHIWMALDQGGVTDQNERRRLSRSIIAELKKRGFKTPAEQKAGNERELKEATEQMLLEDARIHEARIDPRESDED